MRPVGALGLVLVIVGGLVALAIGGLGPVGGALAVCGVALVVFSLIAPRRRAKVTPPAYVDEDDQPREPTELYVPDPGEIRARPNVPGQAPEFTTPTPGSIPPVRQPASGGEAEYTTGRADVPPPREREQPPAEYFPAPGEMPPDDTPRS